MHASAGKCKILLQWLQRYLEGRLERSPNGLRQGAAKGSNYLGKRQVEKKTTEYVLRK